MHRVLHRLAYLCALAAFPAGVAGMGAAEEPRMTVEALRALPPAVLAAGRAVQLSGVVTYLRDTAADFNFILDDGTGGVMVYPAQRAPLALGQQATVQGATRLDRPFFRIVATSLEPGEMGRMPPPLPATLAELMEGRFEGRRVQLEEMVRVARLESAELKPRRLALDFGPRARRLTAWVSHYEGAEGRFAAGARVRVTGVCLRWRNDRAQPVSASLLINSPAEVVDVSPPQTPPPEPLAELLLWSGIEEPAALRTTSGVVTYAEAGELVVVQEGLRALRVRPAAVDAFGGAGDSAALGPGSRVEVSGFPVLGEFTAELEDARVRLAGTGEAPRPEPIREASALLAVPGLVDRDARLVSLTATVREERTREARPTLELTSAGHRFTAWLPVGTELPGGVRAGSEISVSGICTLHLTPERRRLGQQPGDFSLLLRGADDVSVLHAGPWWTRARLLDALAALLLAAALSVAWAAWLRAKNARLRVEITARRRAEQLLAAERGRMAADLHDTLDQTLLAAGLQLGAAVRTLTAAPAAAAEQIALAHHLLARGQQEVRDAVWDLRAGDAQPQPLGALLARVCAEAGACRETKVAFSTEGEVPPLPPFLVAQAVRLAREGVANAIKHGQAGQVAVVLAAGSGRLQLRIADDGCGFDPHAAAGPETGHFGLAGLRERVQRLGGTLEITSASGAGAALTATLPLAHP